jgi:hypothetical protein
MSRGMSVYRSVCPRPSWSGRWTSLAIGTILAGVLACVSAGTALAHAGHSHGAPSDGRIPGQPDLEKIGDTTYRFNEKKEEYEILRPGKPTAFAHGDPAPPRGGDSAASVEEAQGGWVGLPASERNPICRTSGVRIIPIFTRRTWDGTPTPTGTIRSIVKRMNWKINQQSSQSSGGSRAVDMVVECDGSGEINVHNVATSSSNFSTIFTAAENQITEGSVKFLAFESEANPNFGGLGTRYSNSSKSEYNPSASQNGLALIYATNGAWTRHTPIHELFHTLGAAQGDAFVPPPYSNSAHCIDGIDMLCYDDGYPTSNGYTETRCPASSGYETPTAVPIDCGYDTYFNAAPAPSSWLATYWNVAGEEDPYLIAPGAPKAKNPTATSVTANSATLRGEVHSGGYDTTYQFEYGTSKSYGTKVPVPAQSIGPVYRYVEASMSVTGLEPGTEYHYRLAATNSAGSGYAEDKTFVTKSPPIVSTSEAKDITSGAVTLSGTVNPKGTSTGYRFEYGTTTSYGQEIPAYPQLVNVGSGTAPIEVSQTVTGLESNTTYHFRLKASNFYGATFSADRTFTTLPDWAIQDHVSQGYKPEWTDVSCATESECIAVGDADHTWPIGERWDGTKWIYNSTGLGEEALTDVSCGPSAPCLALPASGLNAVRWNGSAWSSAAASTPAEATSPVLRGISCTASSFCIAVGTYSLAGGKTRTLAESWNGSAWTILTTPFEEGGVNELNAVSCTSSISCTAIGRKGGKAIALGWNGSAWSALAAPKEASSASADISCTAANACTTVIGGTAKVERWNGTEWASATVPTPGDGDTPRLFAVSCASASVCTAVGDYTRGLGQGTLAESWDGSAWSVQGTPDAEAQTAGFYSLSCNPSNRCTAVGFLRYEENDSETLAERYRTSPTATTEAATAETTTEATLNATVNPEGYKTTYQFEYGTTTSYGTKVPASAQSIGSGTSNVKVSQVIGGLEFGKTYHFRVVATNAAGTTYGADRSYPLQLEWYVSGVKVGTSEAKGTTVQISGELTWLKPPWRWGPCQVEGTGKIWNYQKKATGNVTSLNSSSEPCQIRYDPTGNGGSNILGCEAHDLIATGLPWSMTTGGSSVQLETVSFSTRFEGCPYSGPSNQEVAWWGSLLGEWTEGETWSNPKGESFNGCIQYNNSGSLKLEGKEAVNTFGPLCMKKAGGGELTLK